MSALPTSHRRPIASPALILAAALLLIVAAAGGASAFSTSVAHADYSASGARVARFLADDIVCYDTWDNGTNATCRTYEEDGAAISPAISSTVYSPGVDHLGTASNRSLLVTLDTGVADMDHGWYVTAGYAATTVEFDIAWANESAALASWLPALACRTAKLSCTDSRRVQHVVNLSSAADTRHTIRYYTGAAYVSENVTNLSTPTAVDWHHVVMHHSSTPAGELYLLSWDDQTWYWDTAISSWANAALQFWFQSTPSLAGGNWTYYIDNLYWLDSSREDVLAILSGNLTTSLSDLTSLVESIVPVLVLLSVVGAALGATRRMGR